MHCGYKRCVTRACLAFPDCSYACRRHRIGIVRPVTGRLVGFDGWFHKRILYLRVIGPILIGLIYWLACKGRTPVNEFSIIGRKSMVEIGRVGRVLGLMLMLQTKVQEGSYGDVRYLGCDAQ